jgi:hypothetical protein
MKPRHAPVVHVHLILRRNGALLLSQRANIGYADRSTAYPAVRRAKGSRESDSIERSRLRRLTQPACYWLPHHMSAVRVERGGSRELPSFAGGLARRQQ